MKIRYFLLHSYLFWAIFSLLNFQLMWFLVVPFLFVVFVPRVLEVFPFLWIPAVIALAASVFLLLAAAVATRRWHTKVFVPILLAYVSNGAFLLVLLVVADHAKNTAIASRLSTRHPDCIQVNPIFESMQNAGGDFNFVAHALFKEDGKTFYWSYRTMDFFEGHERLDRNFPCMQSNDWTALAGRQAPHRSD